MQSVYKISVLLLLVIFLRGNALSAQELFADTVIVAKNVITVDITNATADHVAIMGDRIIAVGSEADIQPFIDDSTRRLELSEHQTLLPGLIESHGHFVGVGQSLMMLDLRPQQTWEEIVATVAEAAKSAPPGTWLIGRGWHQSKWTEPPTPNVDGYPVHGTLSGVTPDHPVLLTHASGHACFANAVAMRRARVDANTKNPSGGEILKDADGQPTGLFRERAAGLISAAQAIAEQLETAEQRDGYLERAVQLAVEECHRNGITSFHDAGSSVPTTDALRKLAEQGKIDVRLYVMIRDSNTALEMNLDRLKVIGAADGRFTVRSIKKSIDGALGPHGAWLLSPYEDLSQSVGLATLEVSEVEQAAKLASEHGYQVCVHAIGDRANREVLDIYERTLPLAELRDGRWRIEHAQHLDPADIPRFGQLGVIAAMQGVHCTSDAPFVPERLGFRRSAQGAYVWRTLLDSGAVICNGTDAPVEPLNPFPSLYASVTRRLADGSQFFAEQVMTREEAIESYTIAGAYAAFEEDEKGSISVGKLADLIVVDRNLITCSDEELRDAKVLATMIGGKIVFGGLLSEKDGN